VLDAVPRCQTTSRYVAVLSISTGQTLDNADPLFALLITPVFFNMHHVEVADQDPARKFSAEVSCGKSHPSTSLFVATVVSH